MSSPHPLGGASRPGRHLGPALDKIIKNAAWRKHSAVVSAAKSALDLLQTLPPSPPAPHPSSPLPDLPPSDADLLLHPLLLALDSSSPKLLLPALSAFSALISHGLFSAEIDPSAAPASAPAPARLLDSACRCSAGSGDDGVEQAALAALLAAVRSPAVLVRGDALAQIVRCCYNVYLSSLSGVSQVLAKAVLSQIVGIVFARVEIGSVDVEVVPVRVGDLLEVSDKGFNDKNVIQTVQGLVDEVVEAGKGVAPLVLRSSGAVGDGVEQSEGEVGGAESADMNGSCVSKIREDGYCLFKNLCKLSLKFAAQESSEDQILLRGKILSLELLKVVMETGGSVWRTDERFLGGIKQYLCLSLLKNSALSAMNVFQLLCSIFMILLSRFRSELKGEIGIFFPMLVLRVLENVLQPSFSQKLIVLNLLENMCEDSQVMIDIFVNYDCDVDAPNIFERIVNGLLKTALGTPPGSSTTLSPSQDLTFRFESVKCLVAIIKSMGSWMDEQLRISDLPKDLELDNDSHSMANGDEECVGDLEANSELPSEPLEASTLEQRRAYKIELQKGIALFNRKPAKGIEFLISTKKVGASPEEVAHFLGNTSGLNETMIGDYLGEREEFSLKVMHSYVDSMNFEGMEFGEAIRFLLRGFRLPGEAQKIDRIMEKFAERYCKCNPGSFASADTAYVLAYSVIMLNTDAHNGMVKDKMTKADFIRNNRGIDNGKDLPEEYLGAVYDQIVKNEIKMKADSFQESKQPVNRLLGLDSILNLVAWKQEEEKALGASSLLIKHIQEQFKAKAGKSESVFYAVTDSAILRFMVEVCWAPMLAAFSMLLDQSDDKAVISQCLQGFRYAVHVTCIMSMQTQRDAFVTSMAKFTYLHHAADMKQKNVDAVKTIISIALEDGNYLQEAWEHVLTCLSRFEHLLLLGEGAPPEASFFTVNLIENEERLQKTGVYSPLKKKGGALQNSAVVAAVRGGSYDSASFSANSLGPVTSEQIKNFISNLNMLEQIGNFELNHIFAHSQMLNSEAIVAFVRALCKVSMSELQSPSDPRVFSLTKIVEIAHYNMGRIRLVWTRIWNVLSDFFVSVGLSENLSIAIFVMDSLRQLAMKFLEREELANYNFQNEFLRPFAIVMQKSDSAEIRELIVRCISQMVLSRVNNVKSGWKSVFMVFTIAAADERKNIVLLAFETMEKIVRDYFPYITETETTTFTDCVRCLITFTNSRFNSDVSLNAIAFLRFCAVKLAEGGLVCYEKTKETALSSPPSTSADCSDGHDLTDKDDYIYFWVPLLTGLSKLTSDPRTAIRKSSLEVLFNILNDHGHLFSRTFWISILNSVVLPIFNFVQTEAYLTALDKGVTSAESHFPATEESSWSAETCGVAAQCLVDLFVNFFNVLQSVLLNIVSVLTSLLKSRNQGYASTGVAALLHLTRSLGNRLQEEEWSEILFSLKEAALSMLPEIMKVVRIMDSIDITDANEDYNGTDLYLSEHIANENMEDDSLHTASFVISRMKSHIAVQLLIIQVMMELYKAFEDSISAANITVIIDIYSSIAWHASELNSKTGLLHKMQKACSILEISDPPLVHFENEAYQNSLKFLQILRSNKPNLAEEMGIESQLVEVCEKILKIYLNCAGCDHQASQLSKDKQKTLHWILPLGPAKKEELAARTSLMVIALQALSDLGAESFRRYLSSFFPLLVNLVRCEHSSGDVQRVLSNVFLSRIGPVIMDS